MIEEIPKRMIRPKNRWAYLEGIICLHRRKAFWIKVYLFRK
jgi:hypothetical protein